MSSAPAHLGPVRGLHSLVGNEAVPQNCPKRAEAAFFGSLL
jgi:hypothetical protein